MGFNIRKNRTPQGRKKLTREREKHLRLMDEGLSSKQACRIGHRTGMRWRNGRKPEQPGAQRMYEWWGWSRAG